MDVEALLGVESLQVIDIPCVGERHAFLVLQFEGAWQEYLSDYKLSSLARDNFCVDPCWFGQGSLLQESFFVCGGCGTFIIFVGTLTTVGAPHHVPRQVGPMRL